MINRGIVIRLFSGLRPLPLAIFDPSRLPFGGLGASMLAPWGTILALGAPWRTMEAAGGTRRGPEHQSHRFWIDLGTLFLKLLGH